jgi:hypothetical protein
MAFIPDLKAGVVMMGNSSGMRYATIAESVLAILMGEDPSEVVPALRIKERMKQLEGTYEVYRGLEKLQVVSQGGLLYLERSDPLTSAPPTRTPLIPEVPTLASTVFYTLSNGIKSPVELRIGDNGEVDLLLGRYRFHKRD